MFVWYFTKGFHIYYLGYPSSNPMGYAKLILKHRIIKLEGRIEIM